MADDTASIHAPLTSGSGPSAGSVVHPSLDILGDLTAELVMNGPDCVISRMIEVRPDLHEQWLRVLPQRQFSARRVAEWFSARGFGMNHGQVQHHRSGGCRRCRTTSSPS